MAEQYSVIQQSSFSTNWSKNYSIPTVSTKDSKRYFFINASSWYIVAKGNYAIFGGSGIFKFRCDYYNGFSWVNVGDTINIDGSSYDGSKYFAHNRDEGNLKYETFHNAYSLWRVTYWSGRNNSNWKMDLYVGGIGMCRNTSSGAWFNYPQHKKIRSIGTTGEQYYYSGSTDASSDVVNSVFNPVNRRGAQIMASNDKELTYYPYMD
jgi:hypothetical protein